MKRIFTLLSAVMFVTLAVNARNNWDFRKWSAATLSALQADMEVNGYANWRNYESDPTKVDQQHYWIARKMAGTLVTNDGTGDKPIKETEGIHFGASAAKKLAISYNHQNKGENGGAFIWLNGKNETMTIPDVQGGQKLKIAIESHSTTEARGFSSITFAGQELVSPTGNFTPIEYTEYEIDLPEGMGNLVFKTTSGCHIYYIIIGEGDDNECNYEDDNNQDNGYNYYLSSTTTGYSLISMGYVIKVIGFDITNNGSESIVLNQVTFKNASTLETEGSSTDQSLLGVLEPGASKSLQVTIYKDIDLIYEWEYTYKGNIYVFKSWETYPYPNTDGIINITDRNQKKVIKKISNGKIIIEKDNKFYNLDGSYLNNY